MFTVVSACLCHLGASCSPDVAGTLAVIWQPYLRSGVLFSAPTPRHEHTRGLGGETSRAEGRGGTRRTAEEGTACGQPEEGTVGCRDAAAD